MSHFVELRQTLPVFLHCQPNVCRILGEESAVQEAVAEGGRAVQGGRETRDAASRRPAATSSAWRASFRKLNVD